MKASLSIKDKKVEIDFSKGKDISIPLIFNGEQPNTYGVDKASSKAYKDGQFIGDTRKGGPCNFETYSLTPHCNGTHTECIGHITKERIDIISCLQQEFIPASLVSILPEKNSENYIPDIESEDLLITKSKLKEHLEHLDQKMLKALIIRTLPNNSEKKYRDYMKSPSAFFSLEAMQYIVDLKVEHLLVDLPSVDRLYDDGLLSAHNIFWGTKNKELNNNARHKTITEMIFVDDNIVDGSYLLNLQIAPFQSDAAPSRPVIYTVHEL